MWKSFLLLLVQCLICPGLNPSFFDPRFWLDIQVSSLGTVDLRWNRQFPRRLIHRSFKWWAILESCDFSRDNWWTLQSGCGSPNNEKPVLMVFTLNAWPFHFWFVLALLWMSQVRPVLGDRFHTHEELPQVMQLFEALETDGLRCLGIYNLSSYHG